VAQYARPSGRVSEVEDALAGLEVFATAAKSQDAAVADSQRAADIALNRIQAGLVTYLDVVTAQQASFPINARPRRIQGGQTWWLRSCW